MLDWTPWRPLGRTLDKHAVPCQRYEQLDLRLILTRTPAPWTRPGWRLKGWRREATLDHWSQRGSQAWQDNYLRASRCPTSSSDRGGHDPNCPSCWSIPSCRCCLLTDQEIGYNQSWLLISAKATLRLGFMMRLPSCSAADNQFPATRDMQMHFIMS